MCFKDHAMGIRGCFTYNWSWIGRHLFVTKKNLSVTNCVTMSKQMTATWCFRSVISHCLQPVYIRMSGSNGCYALYKRRILSSYQNVYFHQQMISRAPEADQGQLQWVSEGFCNNEKQYRSSALLTSQLKASLPQSISQPPGPKQGSRWTWRLSFCRRSRGKPAKVFLIHSTKVLPLSSLLRQAHICRKWHYLLLLFTFIIRPVVDAMFFFTLAREVSLPPSSHCPRWNNPTTTVYFSETKFIVRKLPLWYLSSPQ